MSELLEKASSCVHDPGAELTRGQQEIKQENRVPTTKRIKLHTHITWSAATMFEGLNMSMFVEEWSNMEVAVAEGGPCRSSSSSAATPDTITLSTTERSVSRQRKHCSVLLFYCRISCFIIFWERLDSGRRLDRTVWLFFTRPFCFLSFFSLVFPQTKAIVTRFAESPKKIQLSKKNTITLARIHTQTVENLSKCCK